MRQSNHPPASIVRISVDAGDMAHGLSYGIVFFRFLPGGFKPRQNLSPCSVPLRGIHPCPMPESRTEPPFLAH
jgi:hypothetical protein